MKKRVLAILVAAAMASTMLIGCGSAAPKQEAPAEEAAAEEGSEAAATEAKDMTFVIVPKCVHAWFDQVNIGAMKEADLLSKQTGKKVTIDYRAPETADVTAQNSVLEQAAATHPDGIALDPVDYEGSKAVIDEIQAQGIQIMIFDAEAPEGSGLSCVGNDFTEQATLAADKLAELIGEEGKVAVMQGAPAAPNHAQRYQAHLDALAKYPNIEVVDGGIDNDSIETAKSQAAAVLAANPDLKGFLNCDAGGSGIAAAVEEAGKAGEVLIVSQDIVDNLDYVPGTIQGISSTLPQMQGAYSVLLMWQGANGMDVPAVIDTGIAFIDETNIEQWKELTAGGGFESEARNN